MGKRYYCDYCERSFADGAENRKKHLASVHHQKLRKTHYDTFQSPSLLLEENNAKRPCRKFHQEGHCDYGSCCKYSHLTPEDVQKLQELDRQEKLAAAIEKPRVEPDIDEWVKSKMSKIEKLSSSSTGTTTLIPVLPSVLSNIPNIPPSLIPCKSSDVFHLNKEAPHFWS
ncbi:zinc finger matrin-type protein 5 isoform X2 [Parasteatoda tepidariorum]|uniref:zinc finger matrin-type protein 5 isoform X2 n=1 Tax=Parasteatoda tepidariorum TaxID=114398 RepID=UPI000A2C0124|nr:zinc finger matrin-type protein 5 isoform X2 [Parasteatoda tepidariorum]